MDRMRSRVPRHSAEVRPGETLRLRVRNSAGERELRWKMASRQELDFELTDLDKITPEQQARRAAWLKGEAQAVGASATMIRTIAMLAFWGVWRFHWRPRLLSLDVPHRRYPFSVFRGHGAAAYWGARLAGIRARTVGLDRLDPKRTYVFMSNHVSNIDPPVMLPLIPRRTSVMAKKELFDYPAAGQNDEARVAGAGRSRQSRCGNFGSARRRRSPAPGHQYDHLCRRPSLI